MAATGLRQARFTLETASLGVQLGGESIDIVVVSLDKERR
jgi:hypothetical protein